MISLPEKFSAENLEDENTPSIIVDLQESILEVEEHLLVDWQNNTGESSVDYTPPVPDAGNVILAQLGALAINYESNPSGNIAAEKLGQGFKVDPSIHTNKVQMYLRWNAPGTPTVVRCKIYEGNPDTGSILGTSSSDVTLNNSLTWETFTFATAIPLVAGTQYTITVERISGDSTFESEKDSADGYPDGTAWTYFAGSWGAVSTWDAWFRIYSAYVPTGYIYTDEMDVGLIPSHDGEWSFGDLRPGGSLLVYEAWSSPTGVFGGEETYVGIVVDGQAITDKKRYYRVKASFTRGTNGDTPILQSIKASFTQYVTYSDNSDLGFETALNSISGLTTTIDTFKASTVGQMTLMLEHSATLSVWLATKFPKNKDVIIYAGFRADGWTRQDHIEIFHGQIDSWKLSDKNLVSIVVKDFQKEWSVDVPEKWESAADDVTYTGEHHVDIMLDILQNQINVRDSKIDIDSFVTVKAALSGWKVTRSITGDPIDGKKLMEELRILISAFFIPNADGSISIKRFDAAEIEIDSLTDDDFLTPPVWDANAKDLKNRMLIYLNWDGSGDSAADFSDIDISADVTSQTNNGEIATYQLKDKWTRTAEKTTQITNGLASDILDRYADAPVTLDVVVDRKKIHYEPGDIVKVTTVLAPSSDGSGITDVKFQIVNKNLDFSKDRIKLKLLEV
jgi:hypothetical protein